MADKIFDLYLIIRGASVLFVILSLAYYGFEILSAALMSRGDMELDKIKKRILYMVIALIGIVMLPRLVGWAKDMALPNAWKPPTPN